MQRSRAVSGGLARASQPVLVIATLAAPFAVFFFDRLEPASVLRPDAVAALYLLGIASIGTSGSSLHALAAALLSFVLYEFGAAEATSTAIALSSGDFVVLAAFVASAAIVAWVAAGRTRQVASLTARQAHGTLRHELSERLAEHHDEGSVARSALAFLERTFESEIVMWLGERAFHSGAGTRVPHPPSYLGTPAFDGKWLWIPLNGVDGQLGAVALQRGPDHSSFDDELVHSLSADIAHSVVRARLTGELHQERVANESERLCTALLASVSHDLRTPLTTIMGAAESLRTFGETLPTQDRGDLLSTIEAEGRRLDRYIQNLVDVTRIGDGNLAMDVATSTVDEMIASAVARLRRYDPEVRLDVHIDSDVPQVRVHAALVEQAIFNVLHNASKFSPPGHPIVVHAGLDDHVAVVIEVVDAGPGIPHAERERVFDMFYSADRGDPARAGTGLGLAISQSIVRAHGGEVSAHAGGDGVGTRMRLVLPLVPVGCEPCH
ncbi:ATP-binding protein [Lysobacter sp. TY2-98]|uniref:sensor histidine kinase n=1 Tax=Lysobacter sp. TY2-98 TaxID=2290922 RepID=UPI0013B3A31C|nr:ATP-binding protein [Lysobacter sp. TY2-98]